MSVNYNTSIVREGLILHLDAINSKSFANTTTWYDISGSGNHGTMYGTPVFSTDGGGCFDFSTATGTFSYNTNMGFTFASNMIPTSGSFTLECWIKNPPSVGQCGLFSNAGAADGFRFGVSNTSIYTLIGGAGGYNYTEPSFAYTTSFDVTKWHNIVAVYDRSGTFNSGTPQFQYYLDGIFQGTNSMPSAQIAFTSSIPGLVRNACCGIYSGKLSIFKAYNRALSSSEVIQNFSAFRGRYGI